MKQLRACVRSASALFVLALALGGCEARPPVPAAKEGRATSPEEAAALARALGQRLGAPAGGYRASRDRKGRQLIEYGDRFPSMTVVGRAADGTLRVGCVSSAAEAEAVLVGRAGAQGARGR
jgi:hypothetical protein